MGTGQTGLPESQAPRSGQVQSRWVWPQHPSHPLSGNQVLNSFPSIKNCPSEKGQGGTKVLRVAGRKLPHHVGRGEFSLYWLRRQRGRQQGQVPLGAWAGDSQEGVHPGRASRGERAGGAWGSSWVTTGWEAGWTSQCASPVPIRCRTPGV